MPAGVPPLPQLAREFAQDTRHTLRLWGRRPAFTALAILALAVGIGANTGVFSVVSSLLLRSLPFDRPDQLAVLRWFMPPVDSARQFHDWRRHSSYLADAAVYEGRDANLGAAGEWRRVHVAQVSFNFFTLLGTRPILGRGFASGEDVDAPGWGLAGPNAVAIVSYSLWQQLFAGDPRVLGSTIRIDGNPLTIVGVAPPAFDYPDQASVWKPAAFSGGNYGWETVARLKRGMSWTSARSAFTAEAERLWPNRTAGQWALYPFTLAPLRDQLAGPARQGSLVLMACVALVLLIACTNVANLLMARTADRAAELSIRSALGAGRARLTRQLLTECLLLALAAAFAGLLLASWTVSIAARVQPAALAAQAYSLLDARVLAFAIAVSIGSALLFGILPSLYAGRVPAAGVRGITEKRGARLVRDSLVAAQVMLTVVLLTGSISVGQAFLKLTQTDRGFRAAGIATVSVSLQGTPYGTGERGFGYVEQVLDRLRRLPFVSAASLTEFLPLDAKGFIGGRYAMDGRQPHENSMVVPVFSDYFRAMGAHMLDGRGFSEAELRSHSRVAVVNRRFASEFGPPAAALGRTIAVGNNAPRTIVGIVEDMDYMAEGAMGNQIFVPSQSPGGFAITFVARVSGRAEDRLAMLRDTVQSTDRVVPVFAVKTMDQRVDDALARPHFYRTAIACFAAFALLLAAIGIYGIVSYTVARRSHEIGIRLALGTSPRRLRAALMRQGLVPVVAGGVPGIAGALFAGRLLANLIDGAQSTSAAICAAVLLFICAIAAAGIWLATRPVARLDVLAILRAE